jgi:pimeloyl-ACP methyl ester carboxylesterase
MIAPMSVFVIVHGAWGGGWEWTPVAGLLRRRGHQVFTPTLTGMGDRAHLGRHEPVGLATHVQDVVATIEFENLDDVVLCGASFGGMPVTGAADLVAERISLVIYIDGLVPQDGQSALDLLPEAFGAIVRSRVDADGPEGRVPIPAGLREALVPQGSLADDVRANVLARLCDQPAASFTEPLRLSGAVDQLPRAFIRCTSGDYQDELGGDPIEACARRARAEGWTYREITTPHDPHLFNPVGIVDLLHELAHAGRSEGW